MKVRYFMAPPLGFDDVTNGPAPDRHGRTFPLLAVRRRGSPGWYGRPMDSDPSTEAYEKSGLWMRDRVEAEYNLHYLFKGGPVDVKALAPFLDAFTSLQCVDLIRALSGREQAALFEAAAGVRPLT